MVTRAAPHAAKHLPPASHSDLSVTPLEPLRDVVTSLRAARSRDSLRRRRAALALDAVLETGETFGPDEAGETELDSYDERLFLVEKVKQAGVAALPALLRSLSSTEGHEADWACFLLRELDGPATHDKIVTRLNALLVDPARGDSCKERVLGLLADLRAPVPERVVLQDPDALLERSVRDLLCDLESPQGLTQALDMIFEQVPEAEFENFLYEVVQHGGDRAQPLLSAIVSDSRTPRALAEKLIGWVRPVATSAKKEQPATRGQSVKDLQNAKNAKKVQRAVSRPRMQRALRLLSHGQLGLAHEELAALRDERRDDPAVASALGLCLLRLARPDAALLQLEQAATLAPTVAAHAWNAAVAAHLTDQAGRCYRSLRQYLSCDDERHGAASRRQAAETLCGEFERVLGRAYPSTPIEYVLESEALFEGAYAALSDARYTAAVDGFRAVLERLPAHPASWRNLGIAYLAQRRPREAARCFSRVLRVDANRHALRAEQLDLR